MNILCHKMLDLHEGVIVAAQIIAGVTTNELWDDPKYKAKFKVT